MTVDGAAAVVIRGIGVGRGAVLGPVVRAHPAPVPRRSAAVPADPSAAADDPDAAFAAVADELEVSAAAADGALAEILTATAAMARDPMLVGEATDRVRDGAAQADAVVSVVDEFCAMFTAAGGYLAERVTDLGSVRDRVLARLEGVPAPGVPPLAEPAVVVARDLAPADTARLGLSQVLAIVVAEGGPTSHTAIIANQLGLPCVVRAAGAEDLQDGQVEDRQRAGREQPDGPHGDRGEDADDEQRRRRGSPCRAPGWDAAARRARRLSRRRAAPAAPRAPAWPPSRSPARPPTRRRRPPPTGRRCPPRPGDWRPSRSRRRPETAGLGRVLGARARPEQVGLEG